jgi:hypothetical protein
MRRHNDRGIRGRFWLALSASVTIACGGDGAPRFPDAGTIPDADALRPVEITIKAYPDGFPYRGRTANAGLVAFQDGDGPWTALTGSGGVYHAWVTGQRYAVASGCEAISETNPGAANLNLYYQALSDTKEVHADGCDDANGLVHIKVDLQGAPAGDIIEVRFAGRRAVGDAGSLLELDVPKGMVEPFARSYPPNGGIVVADKGFIAPTVDLQADQTLTYDFGGLGKPFESHPLIVTGLEADEQVIVNSSYTTPTSQIQYPVLTAFDEVHDTYLTLDTALRKPGDITNILALATQASAELEHTRYVRSAFKTIEAKTLALPASFTAAPPRVVDATTSQITVTIPTAAPVLVNRDYGAVFSTTRSSDSASRGLLVRVRPGWVGSALSVIVATPDLSGLPGWLAGMGLFTGKDVRWAIERDDYNLDPDAPPVDGRHILGARVDGVVAAH